MAALQASPFRLNDRALAVLSRDGFVIDGTKVFPSFTDGWLSIFKADLPLYVTADSLLHAVHRSYDAILADVERDDLVGQLHALLLGMRGHLAAADSAILPPRARADADLFTAVALGLLEGAAPKPVAGADATEISKLLDRASLAQGTSPEMLFGRSRTIDFSQFKPRGHYAANAGPSVPGTEPTLAQYFRAMVWLGRIDLPFVDSRRAPAGNVVRELRRRELELACGLSAIMLEPERRAWSELDAAMSTFVGDSDAMTPADVARLYRDLGVSDVHRRVEGIDRREWQSSLYWAWLDAIRALSPPAPTRLPSPVQAEPWGRRILGTQLASWAELRHDTILYAKQSYTVGILCSFPDAYVDPYPNFYVASQRSRTKAARSSTRSPSGRSE